MTLDPSSPYYADFLTNHGSFRVKLFPAQVPVTVNNFVVLARQGYYDGLIFHRVIEDFMVQGGDPTGTGAGGPGYRFDDEIVPGLVFDSPGKLAMANAGPDTNGSQFFITAAPTEWLNGHHTIFGEVIEGQDVVDSISRVATGRADRPLEPVQIETVTISTSVSDLRPTLSSQDRLALSSYAAEHAGGPGAIYVGDLNQLVGPAVTPEQGDYDGNVPLDALERHLWIYESPYYRKLIGKAGLIDPTPMTYNGETIYIQHACINRVLLPCELLETFFVPNLRERTNGRVEFIASSFRELGLAGPDTLGLVRDGTLDSATIYGGYVGGEIPAIEIQNLWGIYASPEQEFSAAQAIIKDVEQLALAETGGVIMNHSWYAGNNQFLFCREKIDTPEGLDGKRTRSHSAALSDWLEGMGAQAQYLSFAEVYSALERGRLDCGVTGSDPGYGQRWYEVTDYLIGPLLSFPFVNNVINAEKWASIPEDVQRIIIEEAAKSELEALRLAAAQNDGSLSKLTTDRGAGQDKMEYVPFSYAMKYESFNTAAREHVVPAWVNRVGDTWHPIIADTFNNKVGPYVGLRIEPDGSVVKVPITQGPHAGKTMEQVLAQ